MKTGEIDLESQVENWNVRGVRPLVTANELRRLYPFTENCLNTVMGARYAIQAMLRGEEKRKLFIVGPCSVHDVSGIKEYTRLLKGLKEQVHDKILLVGRYYFEKPRTCDGWEGMATDPNLDAGFDMNVGLVHARDILVDANENGIPAATEYLDTLQPQYYGSLISWVAIGARNTEGQIYRRMSSGLSAPIGYKNCTNGDISKAIDSMLASRKKKSFKGIDKDNRAVIVDSSGNPYTHLVLRGGEKPNYDESSVNAAQQRLLAAGLFPGIVIDCSHGNSGKDYRRQPEVLEEGLRQIHEGNNDIIGFMIESYLDPGNQKIPADLEGFDRLSISPRISVTDSCLDWKTTAEIVRKAYAYLK